jgi:hypothetical protein
MGDLRTLDEYAALLHTAAPLWPGAPPVTDPVDATAMTAPLDDLMPLVDFLMNRPIDRHEVDEGRLLYPAMHSFRSWLQRDLTPGAGQPPVPGRSSSLAFGPPHG